MQTLILIRHSESKLDPNLPPHQWGLTAFGRRLCVPLAAKLKMYQPGIVVTSDEPKALETGEILAESLGLPCRSAPGLHEHRREVGKIVDREIFLSRLANLFASPKEVIFGLESANQALNRFSEAIQAVMDSCPERSVAIVSHGTVMSLYYGAVTGSDSYQFWRQLGLPGFYTVSWPDRVLQSLVNDIGIPGNEG